MSKTITVTELLDFLVKAHKVSSHVTFEKENGEYAIGISCAWDDNNNFYTQTTSITEEGESNWETLVWDSDYDFFTMNSVLDELIKKEEEREMKRQKRQELLSRLTDEEKELLGVK